MTVESSYALNQNIYMIYDALKTRYNHKNESGFERSQLNFQKLLSNIKLVYTSSLKISYKNKFIHSEFA
jgi:hypothetical protein